MTAVAPPAMSESVETMFDRVEAHVDFRRPNWQDLLRLRDWLKSNPSAVLGAGRDEVDLGELGFGRALLVLSGRVSR